MRIIVTGGSGNVGKYVVDELKKFHEVTIFDVKEPKNKEIAFIKGDILKIGDCRKAFKKADAIAHLAAIPHPLNDPPEKVMNVNVMGTFNVHQAACDLEIEKVVYASSDSSYGFVFSKRDFLPDYLPLDEDHPQKPQDSYGLSKKIGEEIAASLTRMYGITTIPLRICYVWFPEKIEGRTKQNHEVERHLITEEPERLRTGFWIYNDARDVALAFRLAIEVKGLKHEVFLISAEDNATKFNSAELVSKYYTNKITFKKKIEGRQSLADWSKAKKLLGYKPRYAWRDTISN